MARPRPLLLDISHLPHAWGELWRDPEEGIGPALAGFDRPACAGLRIQCHSSRLGWPVETVFPGPDAMPTVRVTDANDVADIHREMGDRHAPDRHADIRRATAIYYRVRESHPDREHLLGAIAMGCRAATSPPWIDLGGGSGGYARVYATRDLAIGVPDEPLDAGRLPHAGTADPDARLLPVIPIGLVGLSSHARLERRKSVPGQIETLIRLFEAA